VNFQSTLIGILSSAAVLFALVVPRMYHDAIPAPEAEITLREVEIATNEEPPPPPPPPPMEEDLPPPPPMALTGLSDIPDPTRVALPSVDVPIPYDLPVDAFQLNAPVSMPTTKFAVSAPKGPRGDGPGKIGGRPGPLAPVAKSSYRVNELDGSPRLIHHPSVAFPSGLASQGVRAGTVTLEVELSEAGRVSVRRVLSSTHAELVSAARYVAQGSRYTPPKKNGLAVKAIMRWPITITQ